MKRVFMVHGWDGFPENHWFPWLKKELEKIGFKVIVPKMPDTSNPKINTWIPFLEKSVGAVDGDTFFIGHSIGCQTIMRYLEKLDGQQKIGGIVFVAGWFNLPFLKTEEEKMIAKPWLETPINTTNIRKVAKNIIAIFSDDDPDVSLDDAKLFEKKLGAKIIIEKNKGHFTSDAGVNKLPIILDIFKRWMK